MELGEGFKLCSGSCISAGRGKGESELLLAFDAGSVQIYDAVSRNCVCSWQLPSDQCLSSPAIYHPPSHKYWAVRNNRWTETANTVELLSWRCDDDMASGKSVHLPESQIFTLLATHTTEHPVVVYSNGGVAVGGANPQLPEKGKRSVTSKVPVLLADTVHCGDVEYVCVVSVARDGSSKAYLRLWSLSHGQVQLLLTTSLTTSSTISECCVCGTSLITITTDGRLCSWNVLDALHSQSLTPTHQSIVTPPPIKSHLVAMSCDYFSLVGVSTDDVRLSIWDVSYLTNQTGSMLSGTPPQCVWCVNGCVLVCGRDDVTLVKTQEGRTYATLAAALGKGQSSAAIGGGQGISGASMEDGCLQSREEVERYRDVVSILTDTTKTPTLERFMKEFVVVPELDYSLVIQRLLGETEFWARDALLRLLQDDMFPSSLVGELLEAALVKKDWVLVSTVLCQCCDCVPEGVLVKLLEAALRLPDSLDGGLTREQLMVSLLSVSVNDALLHLPLSQLPFHSVIRLLEWLCYQVDMIQLLATSTHPNSSHSSQRLSYDCVLDWISVLLDVHFTQLALQPQARHLLSKLHNTVFKQVKCLNHLLIVGATQHMTKATPTNSDNWLYKIEKLPINI